MTISEAHSVKSFIFMLREHSCTKAIKKLSVTESCIFSEWSQRPDSNC